MISRGVSLTTKGNLYEACLQSVLVSGSDLATEGQRLGETGENGEVNGALDVRGVSKGQEEERDGARYHI